MPAQHSIHPEQLKLFMSANEIMEHYQPLDADRLDADETDQELWHEKYREAKDRGMPEDIAAKGVEKPVSLGIEIGSQGKPQIVGGHHRIITMHNENPDALMPVLHYESFGHAQRQSRDAQIGRGGYRYT